MSYSFLEDSNCLTLIVRVLLCNLVVCGVDSTQNSFCGHEPCAVVND